MSVNENDYNGAVGIVHFSDESINDPNCLCFATEGKKADEKWAKLKYGNVFNYKNRIVQLDKNLSGLKKIQHCFGNCSSLQKLFIHGKTLDNDGNEVDIKKPDDWEKQTFAKFVGSFDEAIYSNAGFSNITNVKTVELKFPKLVACADDFRNCSSLETLNTNFSNCLIAEREFENCQKLEEVTFVGGLNKLMYAPAMFANCKKLENFNYRLPVLLSGKKMFYNCILNTDSAKTILGSLTEIKRDNNNRIIIQYKYPKYDYNAGEIVDSYASKAISYDDFGVLDLGVAADDVDSVKNSYELKSAIAKGWKIYINNKLQ